MIAGSAISAMAILRRLFMPPENFRTWSLRFLQAHDFNQRG
jgi:hypothetical protein